MADVTANHADQFVDFNSLPEGPQLKCTFYDWKWAEASNADVKQTIGLGTDAGPEAMCYRQDLLKQAGLPNDRATLAKQWATWTDFLAFGKKYQASATRPEQCLPRSVRPASSRPRSTRADRLRQRRRQAGRREQRRRQDRVEVRQRRAAAGQGITAGLGSVLRPVEQGVLQR